jgi:hypothetical protein
MVVSFVALFFFWFNSGSSFHDFPNFGPGLIAAGSWASGMGWALVLWSLRLLTAVEVIGIVFCFWRKVICCKLYGGLMVFVCFIG